MPPPHGSAPCGGTSWTGCSPWMAPRETLPRCQAPSSPSLLPPSSRLPSSWPAPACTPGPGRPGDVFEREPTLGATDYRARAEAAAAAGKWGDAVVDRFRAVVRSAEDRAILDPQPGRTADEAARALSVPFNSQSGRLARAAATFDGVRYGNRAADSGDYRQMVELDTALDAMKPATAGTAAVTP